VSSGLQRAEQGRSTNPAAWRGQLTSVSEVDMAWLLIVLAGLLETGFAVFLKLSHGFSRIGYTALFAICALGSFALLTVSLKTLEVGPAYAAWTGIGAAGTVLVGMMWLGETATLTRVVCVGLVLVGVIGLQLSGGAAP
jgi:quaternary ammonium compound-resistance protein SugE